MHGFRAVVREANEPVFHADWERRIFAIFGALRGALPPLDAARHAIERMPPARYLASSYYERWLFSIETLLAEAGLVTPEEIEAAQRGELPSAAASSANATHAPTSVQTSSNAKRSPGHSRARFEVGDRIVARYMNPPGHTRLPRYARGKHGVVRHDWGVFPLADAVAHGHGPNSQHCYSVEFAARELWGAGYPARERVFLDLWEDYLEPDRAAVVVPHKTKAGARAIGKRSTPAKKPANPRRQGKP
jgi:nitrile hydratase